jgi:hypothetical protein
LYIYEADDKPINCKKNVQDELKEGSIYYRYGGRNDHIKFIDLSNIIKAEKEKEQKIWHKTIRTMAKAGIQNISILDHKNKRLTGSHDSYLINEELIPKLKFVQQGKFVEGGEPTLQLIGDLQPIRGAFTPVKKVIHPQILSTEDIILDFLNQKDINNPLTYIYAFCDEQVKYLPIHYYLWKQSELEPGFDSSKALEERRIQAVIAKPLLCM